LRLADPNGRGSRGEEMVARAGIEPEIIHMPRSKRLAYKVAVWTNSTRSVCDEQPVRLRTCPNLQAELTRCQSQSEVTSGE
jgi:hypothetical protein